MSKLLASYVAGFIDGEGCIRMQRIVRTRKQRKHRLSTHFACTVEVANTNTEVLRKIQAEYGGRFTDRICNGNPNAKLYAVLQWHARSCYRLVKEIYPFLIVKRKQARLIFHYLKTVENQGNWLGQNYLRARRIKSKLCKKFKLLNKRGIN